jgi:hypothetical protein
MEADQIIRTVQSTSVSQFIYFCKALYMFQTVFSVRYQELKTVHTASGIGLTNTATFCWTASSRWQYWSDKYLKLYVQF